jgi:hypothetical protein
MTDERRGLPSASDMYALSECPGKNALVAELKGRGLIFEAPDPDRESGNRIHAYLAQIALNPEIIRLTLKKQLGLTDREVMTATKCEELRDALLADWAGFSADNIRSLSDLIIERRLWYPNRWAGRFSGQPDYILIKGGEALIVDYKSGRKEAMPAADNLQLRAYAVLLKAARPSLESISAAIVEPWVTWSPERVKYDRIALERAAAEIEGIIEKTVTKAGERHAGAWCDYCPARAHCQEARDYVFAVYKVGLSCGLAELPLGEKGSKVIEDIRSVRAILDQMEACYKQLLIEDPNCLAEHYLHDGRLMPSLIDIAQARKRLHGAGLTDGEIDECATFWPGKLKEKFIAKNPRKAGEKQFCDLLDGLIEECRGEPYIAPLSKKERERRLIKTNPI